METLPSWLLKTSGLLERLPVPSRDVGITGKRNSQLQKRSWEDREDFIIQAADIIHKNMKPEHEYIQKQINKNI